MIRCTTARVDLDAIRANYRALVAYLAQDAALSRAAGQGGGTPPAVIAVVKANAYGHGAVPVARALTEAGAPWLAVADIEEGMELREAGVSPGDEVVFLGSQGPAALQTIDAREMAAWIDTIPYEVLCRLGARVARQYD